MRVAAAKLTLGLEQSRGRVPAGRTDNVDGGTSRKSRVDSQGRASDDRARGSTLREIANSRSSGARLAERTALRGRCSVPPPAPVFPRRSDEIRRRHNENGAFCANFKVVVRGRKRAHRIEGWLGMLGEHIRGQWDAFQVRRRRVLTWGTGGVRLDIFASRGQAIVSPSYAGAYASVPRHFPRICDFSASGTSVFLLGTLANRPLRARAAYSRAELCSLRCTRSPCARERLYALCQPCCACGKDTHLPAGGGGANSTSRRPVSGRLVRSGGTRRYRACAVFPG